MLFVTVQMKLGLQEGGVKCVELGGVGRNLGETGTLAQMKAPPGVSGRVGEDVLC